MTEEIQQKWIANFWKRIAAYLIDGLVLGAVGFLVGISFEGTLIQMGG
ncbi:RDD family protein [Agarivorans gilvus]|nr:RDD family protein [Agarivorans gilvus]